MSIYMSGVALCCGARVIQGFPEDGSHQRRAANKQAVLDYINGVGRPHFQSVGLVMAITVVDLMDGAADALAEFGFEEINRMVNPNSHNTIVTWLYRCREPGDSAARTVGASRLPWNQAATPRFVPQPEHDDDDEDEDVWVEREEPEDDEPMDDDDDEPLDPVRPYPAGVRVFGNVTNTTYVVTSDDGDIITARSTQTQREYRFLPESVRLTP